MPVAPPGATVAAPTVVVDAVAVDAVAGSRSGKEGRPIRGQLGCPIDARRRAFTAQHESAVAVDAGRIGGRPSGMAF